MTVFSEVGSQSTDALSTILHNLCANLERKHERAAILNDANAESRWVRRGSEHFTDGAPSTKRLRALANASIDTTPIKMSKFLIHCKRKLQ